MICIKLSKTIKHWLYFRNIIYNLGLLFYFEVIYMLSKFLKEEST